MRTSSRIALLRFAPVLMLVLLSVVFSVLSERFLQLQNLLNILIQASSLTIVATGMTFVLLTAGIDLSVGSIMFLSAAITAKLVFASCPLWIALLAGLLVGCLCGALNAFFVVKLRMLPFIVTLALLYAERGYALFLTGTRAMNLPESLTRLVSGSVLGIPVPVLIAGVVVATAQALLSNTVRGLHIYAVGNNPERAAKAGIAASSVLRFVYVAAGLCAALGGLVSVAQLGAVSPTFGFQREFSAIAAAVLGGTSLFGGRGTVFPGTVVGALLIQTVESGLVIVNADPYAYPVVMALVIFVAVLLDVTAQKHAANLEQRKIRPLEHAHV